MQPQNPGAIIDRYRELEARRDELNSEAAALTETMQELQALLLSRLDELELTGARGQLGGARVEERVVPNVFDWDNFYAHIKATDAFYLLERRPTIKAYRELLEIGEEVPGVRPFTKRTAVITK